MYSLLFVIIIVVIQKPLLSHSTTAQGPSCQIRHGAEQVVTGLCAGMLAFLPPSLVYWVATCTLRLIAALMTTCI